MPYKDREYAKLRAREYQQRRKREGRKPKDAVVKDGFNEDKLGGLKKGEIGKLKKKVGFEDDTDDSAYAMLEDMRWVYKKVEGRKKLKKFVEADDKNFVVMVKELMKIETSLLATKIRKGEEGAGGGQSVFVVLKGLEDAAVVQGMMDKDVDLRQIQHAINPNADLVPYEEERDTGDAPDEIVKVAERVEDDEPEEAIKEPEAVEVIKEEPVKEEGDEITKLINRIM